MKLQEIKTPVSAITGVGPSLTKILSRVNIFTVGDLLSYFPRGYEDRSVKIPLKDFNSFPRVHTVARVIRHEWFGYGKMRTLKIIINDGTATAALIAFNRAFLEQTLPENSIITVTGQFFVKYNTLQSSSFEAVRLKLPPDTSLEQAVPPDSGIIPIYPLTEGLSQRVLSKAVTTALSQYAHGIEDEIPESLLEARHLMTKQAALHAIHRPVSLQQAELARRTLAYEELYRLQHTIAERAFRHKGAYPAAELDFSAEHTASTENSISTAEFEASLSPLQRQFLQTLPFSLTKDQMAVIYQMDSEIDSGFLQRERILNDIERGIQPESPVPFTMNRLLQGDVGSGKTLTALMVCLRVLNWKGQCAFMAPTEILARQHADTISRLVAPMGISVAFLTSNVKAANRTQLLKALRNGDISIIVGTHALFSAQTVYKDLQLAVIDEQHRFGVMQRQSIVAKGRTSEKMGITFEPHLLMMSATPIPQSLALTVFGDLDVSTIRTLPSGRKPIQTFLVREGNEGNAYDAVRKELAKGRQAYFVYPAINAEDGSVHLKSAEQNFKRLSGSIFPEFKCALLHSRLEEEEQARILKEFNEGKIQLLVATSVIEVGVDVPNATCMVIEQADRFGMAQLHQLRGRVGRGTEQSYCILIYSKNLSESGIERMKTLRHSTDGFFIAEQDLKTRGPGEMNGTLQSGALELGIADLSKDRELLLQARADAIRQLKSKGSHEN